MTDLKKNKKHAPFLKGMAMKIGVMGGASGSFKKDYLGPNKPKVAAE